MSKEGKILIVISTIILLITAVVGIKTFLFIKSIEISMEPMPAKKEVKEAFYELAKERDERELEEIDFVRTTNNKLEGVYGKHYLELKTEDGVEFSINVSNDEPEEIWSDFGENYFHYLSLNKYKEKTQTDFDDEFAYGENAVIHMYEEVDDEYLLDLDQYLTEKAKEKNQTTQEYMDKNKNEIIKEYGVLEIMLLLDDVEKLEDVKKTAKEKREEFYTIYEDAMKLSDVTKVRISIEVYDEQKERYREIILKDDKEKVKLLKKEKFNGIFDNAEEPIEKSR